MNALNALNARIAPSRLTRLAAGASATFAASAAAAAAALAALAASAVQAQPSSPPGAAKASAQVERGRYLVQTSACMDCHTPLKIGANGPEPDMARMLSGHPQSLVMPPAPALPPGPWEVVSSATLTAWSGPWGVSFTANLTPDPETGLGRWTVEDFKQTIRTGRRMGRGRAILPPMPIPVYNHFSDADLEAIFAYLKSLPPISNRVPEPRPPAAASASATASTAITQAPAPAGRK